MRVNTELPTKFYIITYIKKTKCIIYYMNYLKLKTEFYKI